ncbi:aldehyde dehydrogenase family protein [Lichenihabitans sp. PAMC28606]|uniref:aldehyde dehydrogenase family protein n=1 Tax=Lichenihabitans sp. PAMC28606 TaxID=2880932 RepID=UPI001D0B30C8|nr:aldehyde dehydrogenase family protein [Lichenihabitans sp. PAMC28606]UDL93694.1 aldehyde dehydrogenase family protein [Lichenihabitans sp. PAMC28606]
MGPGASIEVDDPGPAYARLRAAWDRAGGLSVELRRDALARLRDGVRLRADAFVESIDTDFGGRARVETLVAEVAAVLRAVDYARPRLARWAANERVGLGLPFWPARAHIRKEPRGVVAILGPSNFPLQLTLLPLIGALAAGCRVLVKPSELVPATADLMAAMLAETFSADEVAVLTGGPDLAVAMTRLPLDHLLFTGSTANGRRVMAAASDHLTPLTLELGGKSPVVVANDADLDKAARAIMAGKLMNAGQTCVAPDYVLVPRAFRDRFVDAAKAAAHALYPDPGMMTTVRGERAQRRLADLTAGLTSVALFDRPVTSSRIMPVLVLDPSLDAPIMRQEIFGPVLPVLAYDRLDDAIAIINDRPRPLALYWFGRDKASLRVLLDRTSSGTVAVNETVLHAAVDALPFGGIGASGFGAYHGQAGFEAFTHRRPVFVQSRFSITRLLQPPYGARAERIIAGMLK